MKAVRGAALALFMMLCATVPAHAGSVQANKTIFFTGLGHAGENSGNDAGAYVMVEKPYKDYEVWKGTSTCNSNRSVPRRPSRTFTRLVGYSAGRLAPAYYLQQMEQRHAVTDVRSVILLDPGVASEFTCDERSGAGYTYATWLRQNPANRLLIINGAATAADGYKGLRDTYLSKLTSQTVGANVGDRVLVCDAPTIKHSRVDEAWKHLIGARTQTSCPPATTLSQYSPRSAPGATPAPAPPDPAPGSPQPQPPSSAQIVVDNRVTNGASAMRADTPAYLSTVTRNYCKRDGCALAGTDVGSGATLTAECIVLGTRTTNGQDNSTVDDGNPGLYSSTRWYGIRWGDGRFGYISEVWIVAGHRGGLGLRGC